MTHKAVASRRDTERARPQNLSPSTRRPALRDVSRARTYIRGVARHVRTGPIRVLLSAAMALSVVLSGPLLIEAGVMSGPVAYALDCRGVHSYRWASAGKGVSYAEGVRADIQYTNPTICNRPGDQDFSLEAVSVCRNGSCDGWMQVGWIKKIEYPAPKLFCEFAPVGPGRVVNELSISAATHAFKVNTAYHGPNQYWDCFLDNYVKFQRTTSFMGFWSGTWLPVWGKQTLSILR